MTPFWEGTLAGYGIAIPVGAIAILIVDVSLRRGFVTGFMAGTGAASADFLYALLAATAGEALASALEPFAYELRLASAIVLLALGGYGLWRARGAGWDGKGKETTNEAGSNRRRVYLQFLGLTLLNPLTVAYFGALILGKGATSVISTADRVTFVAGAALASWSWQTLLAGGGALAHRHLSSLLQLAATIAGNLVVIGLGLRIAIQLLSR